MRLLCLLFPVSLSAQEFNYAEHDISVIDSRDDRTVAYVVIDDCKLKVKKEDLKDPYRVVRTALEHCVDSLKDPR